MANKKTTEQSEYNETLIEIRSSLAQIDTARRDKTLSDQERELLELSAAALREAELIKIQTIESELLKQLEQSVNNLQLKSREIRARVTSMNKAPRAINAVERALLIITQIVKAAARHL